MDDGITEALETDNLALQNMSGGKYVQGNPKFLEMVSNWQKKLGTVDVVLSTWQDVQKKWQALESIFVGSADIRVQLPEDSKRFDGINVDFQDLMRGAPDITNTVEACNLEGRQVSSLLLRYFINAMCFRHAHSSKEQPSCCLVPLGLECLG